MITQNNLKARYSLVAKVLLNFTIAMLCICIAQFNAIGSNNENGYTTSVASEASTSDSEGNTSYCKHPSFHPCKDKSVLNFEQHGYKWPVNSTNGTYTVGDQTFEISINDPDGIFGALHQPADPDDLGSYESDEGIAVGINPYHRDDEIEIIYKLSKVSDKVAFTIRDLDKKYYNGSSKQIEKVCIYGYCDGEPVTPIITSLCGSVKVKDNCAVATTDSYKSKKDESVRVVFDECIDEIKIVYGNASYAPKNPSYSKIFIADDIGFGTALCHSKCKKCSVEPSCVSPIDGSEEEFILYCRRDGIANLFFDIDEPGNGENSKWVATDELGNIVKVADNLPLILPVGVYKIYYINWDNELSAPLNVGANLTNILDNSECAAIGKPAAIEVSTCCDAEASVIELIGTGADGCGTVNVSSTGGSGNNSIWVITDESGSIVSISNEPSFELTAQGVLLIWNLNWNGALTSPLSTGSNLQDIVNSSGCAALSNSVLIVRRSCCTATGAAISLQGGGDALEVCVNDETLQVIDFTLVSPGSGENSAWIITDENGDITLSSSNIPSLNLYAAPLGTIQIWYLNWDGNLNIALTQATNINELVSNSECAKLSNPIVIVKDCCCPFFFRIEERCINGNLLLIPVTNVNDALLQDDFRVVCEKEGVDFEPCSSGPDIYNSDDEIIRGPVREMGEYTAKATCSCTEEFAFTLTQQQIDECAAVAPLVAPLPQVIGVAENSVTLSCEFDGAATFELRKSGDIDFISYNLNKSNDIFFTGLEPCTAYEYRTRVFDANGNSQTCAIQTFTTDGCNVIDIENINLRSLNVTSTSAILTWDNMPEAVYTFYYRLSGQEEWNSYNVTIPYVIIFGLNPCTNYEWALQISVDEFVSEKSSTQLVSTNCEGPRLISPATADIKIGDLNDLQNVELDIFVNPVNKTLSINYFEIPVKSVGIYGVNGQLVKSLNVSSQNFSVIDVSNLEAGVYILITNFTNGIAKNKFILHN